MFDFYDTSINERFFKSASGEIFVYLGTGVYQSDVDNTGYLEVQGIDKDGKIELFNYSEIIFVNEQEFLNHKGAKS